MIHDLGYRQFCCSCFFSLGLVCILSDCVLLPHVDWVLSGWFWIDWYKVESPWNHNICICPGKCAGILTWCDNQSNSHQCADTVTVRQQLAIICGRWWLHRIYLHMTTCKVRCCRWSVHQMSGTYFCKYKCSLILCVLFLQSLQRSKSASWFLAQICSCQVSELEWTGLEWQAGSCQH